MALTISMKITDLDLEIDLSECNLRKTPFQVKNYFYLYITCSNIISYGKIIYE